MTNSHKFQLLLVPIVILSILGSYMIYYATYWGPWAFSDSTEYIVSARNLLAGNGLGYYAPSGNFKPLTLHPPLYSLILSAIGQTGLDLVQSARWLNIFLFGAVLFLSGLFTASLFRSTWLTLMSSTALISLPSLVDVSSGVMTELLFFSASVIGVFLLFFYLTQRKWYLLVLSAVFLGFASLTRLTGMDTIITALMALLILGRVAWRQKIKDSLIMGLISISPSIIWLLYTYSVTHNLAARSFSSPGKLWAATFPLRSSFMEVLWRWLPFQKLFPTYTYQILRNVAVVFCILFFILVGWVIYRRVRVHNTISVSTRLLDFALFWIVFSIGNIAFLVVSFTFTNLQPDLNERIYLPVQIGLVLMILTLIAYGIRESSRPLATGWICAVLALILLYPNGQKSWKLVQQYHQTGLGYTGAVWHSSLTLESLRGIPDIVPIITNEAAAVLLLLNRPAYDFCTLPCDPSKPFGYGNDPQDPIQRVFRVEQAALVLFYPLCGDLQDPTYAKFMGQLATLTKDLVRYFYSCDGVIYFYP